MEVINLFGASGHSKVIADIIKSQGNVVGTVYDDVKKSYTIAGKKVVTPEKNKIEGPLIISIGSAKFRRLISQQYDVAYATAIHSTAIISDSAKIEEGTVVMQGVIVQADVCIGKHCIVNTGASVDHDCFLGDFVHISPHATLCGNVTVGENTQIGAASVVKQGVHIGKNTLIGAGSVVLCDIPDGVIAFGNPCKVIKNLYEVP